MPVCKLLVPKYRHYKPKNLGVVRLNGKDIYLAAYDSPESWEKYHRTIAEWLASGRTGIGTSDNVVANLTVNQLILSYLSFALT